MNLRPRLRRLPYLLAPAALVLIGFAWLRSYLPLDWTVTARDGRVLVMFAEGNWAQYIMPKGAEQPRIDLAWSRARTSPATHWEVLGFEYVSVRGSTSRCALLAIPFYAVALPVAAVAAWSLYALRRSHPRFLPGHCRKCGYDLRQSKDRCPECGTPPEPASNPLSPAPRGEG